jgi:hypothetical protein
MHTQLRAPHQPIPPKMKTSNPVTTIQQLAQSHSAVAAEEHQQGTIMTATNAAFANNNNHHYQHVPVAFVEFRDVQSAGQAMQLLQGKYLLSSDRGAIRIEFAKSKMAANEHFIASFPAPSSLMNGRYH